MPYILTTMSYIGITDENAYYVNTPLSPNFLLILAVK
jgi:hypothetical protein